jgi:hypothetical protein
MPFTVLVPTRLPDADHAHFEVMYHPPRRHGPWPHLALMYSVGEARQRLWVRQAARPDPGCERLEWESLEAPAATQTNLRISDAGPDPGYMRIVAFEQLGTHVVITSNLDRVQLIELARSFVPAGEQKHAPSG